MTSLSVTHPTGGTTGGGSTTVQAGPITVMDKGPNDATLPASPASIASGSEWPRLVFAAASDTNADFVDTMDPDYAGEQITVDVWWVPDTGGAGNVTWEVLWDAVTVGSDLSAPSFAAAQSTTDATPGTAQEVVKSTITFTQAQADAIAANGQFRLRVRRKGTTDTYADDADVTRVHVYRAA